MTSLQGVPALPGSWPEMPGFTVQIKIESQLRLVISQYMFQLKSGHSYLGLKITRWVCRVSICTRHSTTTDQGAAGSQPTGHCLIQGSSNKTDPFYANYISPSQRSKPKVIHFSFFLLFAVFCGYLRLFASIFVRSIFISIHIIGSWLQNPFNLRIMNSLVEL